MYFEPLSVSAYNGTARYYLMMLGCMAGLLYTAVFCFLFSQKVPPPPQCCSPRPGSLYTFILFTLQAEEYAETYWDCM